MAEQYKALTRKYRPQKFEDIVSQEHVSNTLKNAIEGNRLNHAYLFCGPRGVGKTTMARVLARTVNQVDENIDGEALNNTLNIIEMDAASNNKVEDVHALRDQVRIRPQNGRFRIFIIDEVHMLSKQAFNALLKTLEEPPDHAIFIFATTEPHKILPTILSRCQRFDFRRINVEEIAERLHAICEKEKISLDDESRHLIAKKADGSLRDALGILDQAVAFCGTDIRQEELFRALNVVGTDRIFELMEAVEKKDSHAGLTLINSLMEEGYDIQEFLAGLTEHLRNLYLARDAKNLYLIEAPEETKKRYGKAAITFTPDDLMRMLHIVNEAQFRIREARQPRIHFEIAILKLIHMERVGGLKQLLEGLRELNSGATLTTGPASGNPAGHRADAGQKKSNHNQSEVPGSHPASGRLTKKPENREQDNNQRKKVADSSAKPAPDSSGPASSPASAPPGPPSPDTPSNPPAPGSASSPNIPPAPEPPPADPSGGDSKVKEEIDLFGKPSIRRHENTLSRVELEMPENKEVMEQNGSGSGEISGNLALAPRPVQQIEVNSGKAFYFHDVERVWDRFLEELHHHLEKVTSLSMQRAIPVDLDEGQLILECRDPFIYETIQENRKQFSRIFNRMTGQNLQFCPVHKQTNDQKDTLDPYTRFKQLQKKDPALRTIVELFGAELDY